MIQTRDNKKRPLGSRSSFQIAGSIPTFRALARLFQLKTGQSIAAPLIAGFLLFLTMLSAGTAAASTIADASGAIAMTQDSAGDTYVLNSDGSVGFLLGQTTGVECSATATGLVSSSNKISAGSLLYDVTTNRLYIAALTPSGLSVLYATISSTGCNISPVVSLPEEDPVAGFSMALDDTPPSKYSNLYIAAPAGYNGSGDFLYVLNTNSFADYSQANPPPAYSLDYESEYGPVIVDPKSDLVYINDFGGDFTGEPLLLPGLNQTRGFYVFDPGLSQATRIGGYQVPGSTSQVAINAQALLVYGSSQLVIVNQNPGLTQPFTTPITVMNTAASGFSFFTGTTLGSQGQAGGEYIQPPSGSVQNIPAANTYTGISAATIDATRGIVYATAYSASGSPAALTSNSGELLSYSISGLSETLLLDGLAFPADISTQGQIDPWGELLFDAYSDVLLLDGNAVINDSLGTTYTSGALAATSPLCSSAPSPPTITSLVASGGDQVSLLPVDPGLGVSEAGGYAYSIAIPSTINFFSFSTACAPTIGSVTSLTANPNPATAGSSVQFTATVTPATGSGIPAGTVQFTSNGASLGSAVTLIAGSASLSTSSLAAGSDTIVATYSGSPTYSGSSATLDETVNSVLEPAATFSPQSVAFTAVPVNTSVSQVVTLTNTGGAPLNVATALISGDLSLSVKGNCASANLSPAATCSVTVSFQPTSATPSSITGALTFTDNAGGVSNVIQTLPISGTVSATIAPASIEISEAIHVTDASSLAEGILISIPETIHVTDAPSAAEGILISIPEKVHVTDTSRGDLRSGEHEQQRSHD